MDEPLNEPPVTKNEPVVSAETLLELDDQGWRRLSITQTFDRLLIEAVIREPGTVTEVGAAVGRRLTGGAAKFWDLSFPKLLVELRRRGVLAEEDAGLRLRPDFATRLLKTANAHHNNSSHVNPTPGVTLEELQARAKSRAAQEKLQKTTRARAPVKRAASKSKAAVRAATMPKKRTPKRPASDLAPTASVEAAPAIQKSAAPTPAAKTPAKTLFTSKRVNRLLDALDNTTLTTVQLSRKLEVNTADLQAFLRSTTSQEITRVTSDSMVTLHWKGRELARTKSADRRMALIALVPELRADADGDGDGS